MDWMLIAWAGIVIVLVLGWAVWPRKPKRERRGDTACSLPLTGMIPSDEELDREAQRTAEAAREAYLRRATIQRYFDARAAENDKLIEHRRNAYLQRKGRRW